MQYEGLVCTALEFIRGNGGAVLTAAGTPALTEPATVEALRWMAALIHEHDVTPATVTTMTEESTRRMFQSGRAIFMRNWPYAWPLLTADGSPVAGRVGVTTLPSFDGHRSAPTTETLVVYAYALMYRTLQFGYGSAVAVATFAVIFLVSLVYLRALRRAWGLEATNAERGWG